MAHSRMRSPSRQAESLPRAGLRVAAELRRQANKAEAAALDSALREAGGFETRAADLLGISRTTLRYMLATRHRSVQRRAAKRREKRGYRGGKPRNGT